MQVGSRRKSAAVLFWVALASEREHVSTSGGEIAGEWKDYCYLPCGDRLSSYEGKACEYDAVGNPTLYLGKAAVWTKGRQLTSLGDTTYSYNGRGQRTAKNGISYVYDSEGRVLKQSDGIEYVYDGERAIGIIAGDLMYAYRRNAQGDITALLDNNGNVVVRYVYDAWGGHKVLSGTYGEENVPEIGHKNPCATAAAITTQRRGCTTYRRATTTPKRVGL